MLPWRWNLIPPNQIKDTIFDGLKPMKLIDNGYIDTTELETVFALKSVPKNPDRTSRYLRVDFHRMLSNLKL